MPQAPTCKVCGATHWSGEPHVFAKAAPKAVRAPKATPEPVAAAVADDSLVRYLAEKRAAQATYMREYRAGVRRRGNAADS